MTDSKQTFSALVQVLKSEMGSLTVKSDKPTYFCIEAYTGPSTLRAWKGKMRSATIPVAWVKSSKTYVSYHLMGLYMNPAMGKRIPKELKARMQGKTCFNFRSIDPELFAQLGELTRESIEAFRKGGFISDEAVGRP